MTDEVNELYRWKIDLDLRSVWFLPFNGFKIVAGILVPLIVVYSPDRADSGIW